jgi:hypothetical protein
MPDIVIGHLGRNRRKNKGCGKPVGFPHPQIRWRYFFSLSRPSPQEGPKQCWINHIACFFLLTPLPSEARLYSLFLLSDPFVRDGRAVIANGVIELTVPCQIIGAENIALPIVTQYTILVYIIGVVLVRDLQPLSIAALIVSMM